MPPKAPSKNPVNAAKNTQKPPKKTPEPIKTARKESYGYIYNPARPRDQQMVENDLIARGWRFASRTILGPGGKLQWHSHHAKNTHLLIEGEIMFVHEHWGIPNYNAPTTYNAANGEVLIDMDADKLYRATAGPQGCVFIEGHKVLSPTTADRFTQADRRTFIKVYESDPRYPTSFKPVVV